MKISGLEYERAEYDRIAKILEDAAESMRNAADPAVVVHAREKQMASGLIPHVENCVRERDAMEVSG